MKFPCLRCGAPVTVAASLDVGPGQPQAVQCPQCQAVYGVAVDVETQKPRVSLGQPRPQSPFAGLAAGQMVQFPGDGLAGLLGMAPRGGQHTTTRELVEVELAEGQRLAIGHDAEGDTFVRLEASEAANGEWRGVCPRCLLHVAGAFMRSALRAQEAKKLHAELRGVPLKCVHVVQPGESLREIARQHYGVPEKEADLYYANRDVLRPGEPPMPGDPLRVPAQSTQGDGT